MKRKKIMTLLEAWVAGNGTATYRHDGIHMVVTFVNDEAVNITFTGKFAYHTHPSFLGQFMREIGIPTTGGWTPSTQVS
jgi:hypothetical protein